MPYARKRRRFARRPAYRSSFKSGRRYYRSRYRRRSTPYRRRLAGNLHNFKRVEFAQNLSETTDAITGQYLTAVAFRLQDVTGYADLVQLFDAYRIMAIKFTLIPMQNVYEDPATQMPQIVMAADYDDQSNPANIENMLQRAGAKMTAFNKPVSKYIKPAVAAEAFISLLAGGTGYMQKRNQWINTENSDVKHYGIKWAFQADGSQVIRYQSKVTYYLQFKQPIRR